MADIIFNETSGRNDIKSAPFVLKEQTTSPKTGIKAFPVEEKYLTLTTHLFDLKKSEAEDILVKTQIKADHYGSRLLTTEVLEKSGLSPKHKLLLNDLTVYFSPVYNSGKEHKGVTAYVEKDGQITARTYYLSNSQGLWRYLPDYLAWYSGSIIGKGHDEASVTLPAFIQKSLAKIAEPSEILSLPPELQKLVFYGTTYQMHEKTKKGDYYHEIDALPVNFASLTSSPHAKVKPENLLLPRELSPNFQTPQDVWMQNTDLYGAVFMSTFPSMDNNFRFIFCRDTLDRAWIGGIETLSPLQSTGLRKNWVDAGDLTTPAFELYKEYNGKLVDQSFGYWNLDLRKGNYIDTYANYLSKIPAIQEYQRVRKQRSTT